MRQALKQTGIGRAGRFFVVLILSVVMSSLAFGLGFVLRTPVDHTELYRSMNDFVEIVPPVWGLVLTAAAVCFPVGVYFGSRVLTGVASAAAHFAWLYAAIVYGVDGNWIWLFALAIPNALSWAYLNTRVNDYRNTLDLYDVVPASRCPTRYYVCRCETPCDEL